MNNKPLTFVYRGNFGVPWSTEQHVARDAESLGHRVIRVQENEVDWATTLKTVETEDVDVFLFTSTFGFAESWDRDEERETLKKIDQIVPTVALHLDLFIGLPREDQLSWVPWFKCRFVFTADGGHDDEFKSYGVNHHWMLPAVFSGETTGGTPRKEYDSAVWRVSSRERSSRRTHTFPTKNIPKPS
jgi:hypothetical protein